MGEKKTRSVQYALRWRPVCNRWRLVGNRWRLVGNRWRLVGSHQTSESACHSKKTKKKRVSVLMAPPGGTALRGDAVGKGVGRPGGPGTRRKHTHDGRDTHAPPYRSRSAPSLTGVSKSRRLLQWRGKGRAGAHTTRRTLAADQEDRHPRWNAGLLHVYTGGQAVQSAERNVARPWPIRPEVPFCQRVRHGDTRGQSTERTKAEAMQRNVATTAKQQLPDLTAPPPPPNTYTA